MLDLASVALVAGGLILLLSGAVLSIYGVAVLGVIVGGGSGYLVAPTIGDAVGADGLVAVGVAVVVGALAGLVITYVLLSMAIAAAGFAVGTYIGFVAIAPLLDEGTIITALAGLAVGIAAAFLGMFLTRTTMVIITSFLGAALASRSLTPADFSAAQSSFSPEPLLFDLVGPIFLGLFVLGILSQFGLFKLGYVTKLTKLLPGATVLRDQRDERATK